MLFIFFNEETNELWLPQPPNTSEISLAFPKSDHLSPTGREMEHAVITGSKKRCEIKKQC